MDWLSGLDLDAILEPISEEQPCGKNLRDDSSHASVYYKIKSLRNEARALERRRMRGEKDAPPAETCWRALINLTIDTLTKDTKDLELCAYLIEALIREHDFPGLHDGFLLARELCERFWDTVYPLPDEAGFETRVVYLAGLNGVDSEGTLIRPILMCPLTAGESVTPCSTAAYQRSQQFESLSEDEQRQRIEEGVLSPDMVETAVKETPDNFLTAQREHIQTCIDEYGRLTAFLDENCGEHAPHSSALQTALTTCAETLRYVAGHRLIDQVPEEIEEPAAEDDTSGTEESGEPTESVVAGSAPATQAGPGEIRTRADALKCIGLVAQYFREAEPHSPLSYAADQLVRWGGMALPELLVETLPDPDARAYLFTLMGIPQEQPGGEPEYH